jgi:hypothetical protein
MFPKYLHHLHLERMVKFKYLMPFQAIIKKVPPRARRRNLLSQI